MTVTDYIFRYDHGAFWGAKLAFKHYHVPLNRITKKLADPFLDSRTCYRALHKTGLANEYVVQDFGLAASKAPEFMKYVSEKLPEFQMFLCPIMSAAGIGITDRISSEIFDRGKHLQNEWVIGIGVYGRGPSNPEAFVKLNRELEAFAHECLGTKLLYARTYYTEEEFWSMYDKNHYDTMREKYNASSLLTMYDKLKADMSKNPPNRPIRGLLEALFEKFTGGKNYLVK
jgi:delta24-sterol reductase